MKDGVLSARIAELDVAELDHVAPAVTLARGTLTARRAGGSSGATNENIITKSVEPEPRPKRAG